MEDYIQDAVTELTSYAEEVKKKLLNFLSQDQIDELLERLKTEEVPRTLPQPLYFSFRGLQITQRIFSYIEKLPDKIDLKEVISVVCRDFWEAGFTIGASIPSFEALNNGLLYDVKGNKAVLSNARTAKYQEHRNMLEEVAAVARGEWESGSTLLHHQMKKFISEEYEDNVGKHPFLNLSDKSILGKCKEVAESMGRPDLIFGYKKT